MEAVIHMEYSNVGLPKSFAERFHNIMSYFGYRTFSEFVVETVRQRLQEMETKYEIAQFEKDRKAEHE